MVGADVNATTAKQDSPLILASKNGHLPVVKLLVDRNAAVESTRNSTGVSSIFVNLHLLYYFIVNNQCVPGKQAFCLI